MHFNFKKAEFHYEFQSKLKLEHVMGENNVSDWSKLDRHVVKIAKTFNHMASMFGTFDFDSVASGSQTVQKERRVRRKADPGVEKRPISVTQSDDAATKTTKVDLVLSKIQNVSTILVYCVTTWIVIESIDRK